MHFKWLHRKSSIGFISGYHIGHLIKPRHPICLLSKTQYLGVSLPDTHDEVSLHHFGAKYVISKLKDNGKYLLEFRNNRTNFTNFSNKFKYAVIFKFHLMKHNVFAFYSSRYITFFYIPGVVFTHARRIATWRDCTVMTIYFSFKTFGSFESSQIFQWGFRGAPSPLEGWCNLIKNQPTKSRLKNKFKIFFQIFRVSIEVERVTFLNCNPLYENTKTITYCVPNSSINKTSVNFSIAPYFEKESVRSFFVKKPINIDVVFRNDCSNLLF